MDRPALRIVIFLGLLLLICRDTRADKLVLVAGGGTGGDGVPAEQAALHAPFGIDFDSAGNMYIVELSGGHLHRIDSKGVFSTLGGNGKKGDAGDNGPVAQAVFNGMHHVAVGPHDQIYIADTWNNRIRRMDAKTGIITPFAGTGKKGYSGDGGPAIAAECGGIYCLAFDSGFKKLYFADLDNRRIRAVNMETGTIETVAGTGQRGVPADGAEAKSSPLVDPRAVAVDKAGNIYILERSGHALRVVHPDGKIYTVAGTGKSGMSGDGGDARLATFNGPKHLCVDHDQSVLIADTENHVIRRYLPAEKKMVRVAGTGKKGTAGVGGSLDKCELSQPHGVYVRADKTLYITDSSNDRILKVVGD